MAKRAEMDYCTTLHNKALHLTEFGSVFEKFAGEIVSVEDHPRVLEGAWSAARTAGTGLDAGSGLR